MLIQLVHWLQLKKRSGEPLQKIASFFNLLNDEEERAKLTIDHLLYILACSHDIYHSKPDSPNSLYM